MGFTSWARFFLGLFLSIEVLRMYITGDALSIWALTLAVLFIIMSAWFFVARFIIKG